MIAIYQHGDEESPGHLGEILTQASLPCRIFCLHETNEVPDIERSHTILLGGPMSVNDFEVYPFLIQELEQVRSLVRMGSPVLGICLGAQLLAAATGSKVYPGEREVGWSRVTTTGNNAPFALPKSFHVFQWHNDTFDLPEGARLVCRGEKVTHQLFTIGSGTGVQFHMEATPDIIGCWSSSLPGEERGAIIRDTPRFIDQSYEICQQITGAFLQGACVP